jgi:uncharacterized protein YbaP (TraB family)
MIRKLVSIAAALLLAACGGEPDAPEPSPALWEVSDAEGHKGWLFGTVHALPDGLAWRTPLLVSTFDKADLLVVEVSDLGATDLAQQAFSALAVSPDLPPLLSRVPAADRPALAAAIARAGMTEAQFANTETWAAALQIANVERTGETENGVDRALLTLGLPVTSLESFAEQFAIFDQLAEEDQRVLLTEAAEQPDPAEERAMVEAWAAGDTRTLQREIDSGFLTDPVLRQALLIGRNEDWAEQIADIFAKNRAPFIAVGAGHLLGPEGLPALLEAKGFTVKRIQ